MPKLDATTAIQIAKNPHYNWGKYGYTFEQVKECIAMIIIKK